MELRPAPRSQTPPRVSSSPPCPASPWRAQPLAPWASSPPCPALAAPRRRAPGGCRWRRTIQPGTAAPHPASSAARTAGTPRPCPVGSAGSQGRTQACQVGGPPPAAGARSPLAGRRGPRRGCGRNRSPAPWSAAPRRPRLAAPTRRGCPLRAAPPGRCGASARPRADPAAAALASASPAAAASACPAPAPGTSPAAVQWGPTPAAPPAAGSAAAEQPSPRDPVDASVPNSAGESVWIAGAPPGSAGSAAAEVPEPAASASARPAAAEPAS
mmetsp:Transcript_326/g.823  ORF Transcript_326/g.823 Transcript_326/m.823 type:complete len:271 (-) Transcript_326:160-972(-)